MTNKTNYIERVVEQELVNMVRYIGGLCYKFNSASQSGVPDRIVLYKGHTYFVELKQPGEKPRPEQLAVHKEMNKQDIPVYVLDDLEKVDAFVEAMKTYEGEIPYPERFYYKPEKEPQKIILSILT